MERVNAELRKEVRKLNEAYRDLEHLFHGTQIPTLFLDSDLRIKRFTRNATELFRLTESDVGRPVTDIAPRFTDEFVSALKTVQGTLAPIDRTIHVAEDGSTYLMRILPYRRLDNVIDGFVVTFQNLSQLTLPTEQQARLAAIVDSAHDPIVSQTLDGTITSWNAAATRLFGFAEEEAVGGSMSLIVPIDRQADRQATQAQLLRGERVLPYESVRQTRDGRRVPVLVAVSPVRDNAGRVIGSSDIFHDLTQLKHAETRFQSAFDSSPNGMVMADADGRIVLVNKEVEHLFGYTRDELMGEPVEKLVPPRFREHHPSLRATFKGHPEKRPMGAGRELFGLRKDGSELPIEIGLTPVATKEGFFVIAAIVDVSLRKHAEALREEASRKDRFLSILSHELRGPLASLRICVNLLESKVTGGGRTREAVEIADRQLEHLASLVDQLLDASRIANGKFVLDRKVRDFVEIVRTSAEDQRRVLEAGGVQLTLRLPAEPLWVNVDALRVSQIIVNLLGNALKFSPHGGQAELTVARDEAQNVAVLRVRDEGAGIEPEVLPLVFQPFTRVDPQDSRDLDGLGLGLALVQSLVQTHGGSVEAKSEGPGRGTEIIVRLPLVQPADAAAAASRESSRPAPARRRIMVVEDHRDTAKSMRWSLEARGHEVVVVSDGHSALATVPTFHPEVVLCDIGLPGGMDGYGIAEAIRHDSASGNPHLIAVTGYGMPADKARAMKAGFDHFVVKGGPPRALLDLVDRLAARPLDPATPGREAGPK